MKKGWFCEVFVMVVSRESEYRGIAKLACAKPQVAWRGGVPVWTFLVSKVSTTVFRRACTSALGTWQGVFSYRRIPLLLEARRSSYMLSTQRAQLSLV